VIAGLRPHVRDYARLFGGCDLGNPACCATSEFRGVSQHKGAVPAGNLSWIDQRRCSHAYHGCTLATAAQRTPQRDGELKYVCFEVPIDLTYLSPCVDGRRASAFFRLRGRGAPRCGT